MPEIGIMVGETVAREASPHSLRSLPLLCLAGGGTGGIRAEGGSGVWRRCNRASEQ
jgi:hypothetical protein